MSKLDVSGNNEMPIMPRNNNVESQANEIKKPNLKNSSSQQSAITSDDMEIADLTIQIIEFINILITTVSTVGMKAVKNHDLNAKDAYHQYRQFLLFTQALHKMFLDEDLANPLLEFFEAQLSKRPVRHDEHIIENYNKFYTEMFHTFAGLINLKDRRKMQKILKETQNELDADFSYEAGLTH